jgi:hypothetical protein
LKYFETKIVISQGWTSFFLISAVCIFVNFLPNELNGIGQTNELANHPLFSSILISAPADVLYLLSLV